MEWQWFMFGVAIGAAATGVPALHFLGRACNGWEMASEREAELQAELAAVKEQLAERFSEVVK
jgi:hypothetical protein